MKSYARHRWFALFAFFLFELIHNTDKLMIGPLTSSIMATFGINEAQMGAVSTAALLVGTLLFPVWGYLYDRFARPKLLALASFIWGVTTMLNARAATFPAFMLTRATTGIDDSSYSGLESMVADFFEPKMRGRAYGLLLIAPSVGYLLAMILAILFAGTLGWRNLYVLTGSVGILVAALIFFGVRDPQRGGSEPEVSATGRVVTAPFSWATARGLFRKPTMILMFAQGVFGVIPWQVLVFWIFRYLETERFFTSTEVLVTMVGVVAVMALGYGVSGALGDWAFRRTPRGRLLVSSASLGLTFMLSQLTFRLPAPNHLAFSGVLIVTAFFMTFAAPQTPPTVSDVVLPEVRSTALAILYLFQNSAAALAPLLAGLIAVRAGLGQAFLIICWSWAVAAVLVACCAVVLPRDGAALRRELQCRAGQAPSSPDEVAQLQLQKG